MDWSVFDEPEAAGAPAPVTVPSLVLDTVADLDQSLEGLEAVERRKALLLAEPGPVTARSYAAVLDASTSGRRATPIRKSFVRRDDGTPAPLARIYRGGRSGIVAVKVYLALVWRCSAAPFTTDKPARAWATLLGLEDPEGKGSRRVAAALKTLADEHLITLTPQAGRPNLVTLLDESGDGSPYTLPSTSYYRAPKGPAGKEQRDRNRYFLVPSQLWLDGDIAVLDGPALVMLLILLAEQGGQGKPVWFSTEAFPSRYHVSPGTRASGTYRLQQRLLLSVGRELVTRPGGTVFDTRRYRNVYFLKHAARAPIQDPVDTAPPTPRKRRRRKTADATQAPA